MAMVMNERERVKSLLDMGDFSDNIYKDIQLLIRYFVNDEHMKIQDEIIDRTIDLLEDKLPIFCTWEWEDTIESIVKQELKNKTPITEVSNVYITRKEIEVIRKLKKAPHRKYLFTLMVYTRYISKKKGVDIEWTNGDLKYQEQILKSANVNNLPFKEQHLVAKDLIDGGYISQTIKLKSLSLKLNCLSSFKEKDVDSEDNIELWVNSFDDLGNLIEDYLKLTYGGYKRCERCDKIFKPKSNRGKYCNPCAKAENIRKTMENRKKGSKSLI